MFENIGGKIKNYVKIMTWVGFAGSICYFVLGCIEAGASGGSPFGVLVALIAAILVGLFSWVGNFFSYAFGEMVDQIEMQTNLLYELVHYQSVDFRNRPNGAGNIDPTWKQVQMEQENQDPQ